MVSAKPWETELLALFNPAQGQRPFCSSVASDEFACSVDGFNVCSINVQAAFILAIISLLMNQRGLSTGWASSTPDRHYAHQRKRHQSLSVRLGGTLSPVRFEPGSRGITAIYSDSQSECSWVSLQPRLRGGGRGIRTPGTLSGTAVFKTACFNHSHIPPPSFTESTLQLFASGKKSR
jgi:hypothetical protein